jgi:predicted ATPase
VASAEFPHLYALKDVLASVRFLQIDPQSSRRPSDRLAGRQLAADASNLATVLAKLREETKTEERPAGVLPDIAADLASLIPSVQGIDLIDDVGAREYSYKIALSDDLTFSSRVISDGTVRLLALLTVLNDPSRRGVLCFEEPENGVHEGRIKQLVDLLRKATEDAESGGQSRLFQVLINTHSPAVMAALRDTEVVAADTVATIGPGSGARSSRTRMRILPPAQSSLFDPSESLSRPEIDLLLKRRGEAA